MRLFLTLLTAIYFSLPIFAQSESAEFMKKGVDFYLRGDYDSAREMFSHVDGSSETKGAAAYYLASIAAYKGESDALKLFEDAISNAPSEMRGAALLGAAKYASANGKWSEISAVMKSHLEYVKKSSVLEFLYAQALWNAGDKSQSEAELKSMLESGFANPSSEGADLFVEARLAGEPFAEIFDISKLSDSSAAAKARLEMLKDESISQNQSDISVAAQIAMASSSKIFSADVLKSSLAAVKDSPFAWRAELVLGQIALSHSDYSKALDCARTAARLAPPDMSVAWPVYMLEGDALRMMKKYDDARYAYLKIAMDKNARGEAHAEALYKVGICWFEEGDWGKAHAYFERVFVGYFKFEYWGARAYYYDARALYSMKLTRDANATLAEYLRRAKDRESDIYKEAKKFYDDI